MFKTKPIAENQNDNLVFLSFGFFFIRYCFEFRVSIFEFLV